MGRICFHKIQIVDRTIVAVDLNSLFPGWLSGTTLFLEASTCLLHALSMFRLGRCMPWPPGLLNPPRGFTCKYFINQRLEESHYLWEFLSATQAFNEAVRSLCH